VGGISHCMSVARDLAALPESKWNALLKKLPDSCDKPDCTGVRSCRKRVGDYVAMQRAIRRNIGPPKAPEASSPEPKKKRTR
jgi:hypothetical protein